MLGISDLEENREHEEVVWSKCNQRNGFVETGSALGPLRKTGKQWSIVHNELFTLFYWNTTITECKNRN